MQTISWDVEILWHGKPVMTQKIDEHTKGVHSMGTAQSFAESMYAMALELENEISGIKMNASHRASIANAVSSRIVAKNII